MREQEGCHWTHPESAPEWLRLSYEVLRTDYSMLSRGEWAAMDRGGSVVVLEVSESDAAGAGMLNVDYDVIWSEARRDVLHEYALVEREGERYFEGLD